MQRPLVILFYHNQVGGQATHMIAWYLYLFHVSQKVYIVFCTSEQVYIHALIGPLPSSGALVALLSLFMLT